MRYLVKTLPSLRDRIIQRLSLNDQNRFDNLVKQIENNPYVGDSLQIKFFREKRFDGKRVYFIIFEDLKAVLVVAISDKRTQQKTIDFIRNNLNNYRELLKEILYKQD